MSATPPIPPAHLRGAIDLSSLVAPPAGARQAAAPRSGTAQQGAAADAVEVPGLVLAGTDADFTRFIELSQVVPVLVDLRASWSEPSAALSPVLERITVELGGRLVLVALDVDTNPQLAQAFQAQSVPTVAAVIGGRPVPLFSGVMDEAQLRDVVDQVLALAAEHGVVGTAVVVGGGDGSTAPPEPPLPPHHAEAQDAIARGDYAAAATEYRTAIAQNPRDSLAVAALAQVHLLQRLEDADAQTVRAAAAADPTDLAAALAVADLDVAGGHVDDAFDRILTLFVRLDPDGKQTARGRLVELFEVVGQDDPRVAAARRRLTMLLF